ncbi:zinc ribbon domain-containing protein [Pleurocapsa sp. FMAR1]|uniref:zinc ribbon domain-containing protein n=1 Tax=Pleurocapsa sp. FMAR1 TaxID=3040204 RepID=UPI0029C779CA|nr:zinc ribbon domain-containing protein [Pleurocapsa sp. FMAR1]
MIKDCCNPCGYIIDLLPLSIRKWNCPSCNSHNLRDYNSSLNILAVGQTVFACGLSQ